MTSQIQDEIFAAGAGGQGVLAFGKLLVQSAVEEEKFVTYYPSYGAEIRGGTANCAVIISDREIGSPVVSLYKTMIIMNAPSYAKFLSRLAPDGMLIVNSSLVDIHTGQKNGAGQGKNKTIGIPASEIARRVGDLRCANVVMLGAYTKLKNIISENSAVESIKKFFSKTPPAVIQLNLKAFKEGMVAAGAGE
ncbi:MAG: 2-oxoacid:acceptor oxidoreductase family protein [Elusimicrobiota bacterium]